MKKFINILLAAAVTALAVVSCQKEEQVKPGTPDPEGCYGVYFPIQEASGSHIYSPDMDRSVTITVARTNTSGAITVPFTVVSEDKDVFQFGDIEFADGQDETELEVTFDDIEEGKNCSFSVQLNDDNAYVSHYNSGAIAFDFSVLCVEMVDFMTEDGSKKAMLTFSDDVFWGEVHDDVYLQYYEVNGIRYCTTTGGKLVSPADGTEGEGPWGTDVQMSFLWHTDVQLEVNGVKYDYIEVLPQYHGWFNSTRNSEVWYADYYNYYQNNASTPYNGDAIKFYTNNGESYPPCYYDGHGGFIFNLAYYMPTSGGYWYGFKLNSPVAIAEGYLRVDYSLEVDADYPDKGITPILFTVGADVAKVDYAIYEGSLNSVQVQARVDAISAGKEENVVTVSEFTFDEDAGIYYAKFGVSPETTGEYTLVAVSFNKTTEEITESVAQNAQSLSFYHVAAADDENLDVKVSVFTEDTPARYKNFHKYDSFAYGVSGEDLKEVHIAFYTASVVQKYGTDAVLNDAKADLDGEYVVSEDVLAEINADGGYYTIAEKMDPKTTYYVVVWATNGSKEGYAIANYTTEALPYVWNSLGKGTITDGFFFGMFDKPDTTVPCDVFEEANTPGLYMVTGFQCALAAGFFGITPEQMAPYEGGNWRNAEIVIDATKPNAVVIEAQDYGVCVNGNSYGFFMIQTEPTGTLENNAITWPAEEMYVGAPIPGKWWYANPGGTFKITLPSAVGETPSIAPATASNGQVKDEVMSSSATRYNMPVVKYEREVKSISVETKAVNYSGRNVSQPKGGKVETKAVTPFVK